MMKQPRETKTEIDLSTLIDPKELLANSEDDCFGVEWDPSNKDCSICHDVEICGIVKQKTIQGRVKKIEKEKGPMLDQTAFEKVPIDKIVETIKQWAEDGEPSTFDELEETIMKYARTKDTVAVREYIKRTLPRHGLRVTENKTVVPDESIDNNLKQYPSTTSEASV